MNLNKVEGDFVNLYIGKVFSNWSNCESFISNWAKSKGFNIIKDRVH